MHPKAKQLALAGFLPMRNIQSTGAHSYRIKRQERHSENYAIWHARLQEWGTGVAGSLSEYGAIEWDAWPTEQWDMLPDALIEKLIQGEPK